MLAAAKLDTKKIKYLFTDIDDTLTTDGKLPADSYKALWDLHAKDKLIIVVTGRPAGWCEMIARFWPVYAVIGENGGFYFSYKNKTMYRDYVQTEAQRRENTKKLKAVKNDVLSQVPAAAVSSDQFCRQLDLAIDFCEDVKPLEKKDIHKIVEIFKAHGAQAKISSIHVNGWFGDFDKLSMCERLIQNEFGVKLDQIQDQCVFIGDSPNDEPMFKSFQNSVAVANIKNFLEDLKDKPKFITKNKSAMGFVEFSQLF